MNAGDRARLAEEERQRETDSEDRYDARHLWPLFAAAALSAGAAPKAAGQRADEMLVEYRARGFRR